MAYDHSGSRHAGFGCSSVSGGDVWWVAKNTDMELRRDAGARDRSESDRLIVVAKAMR